MYFLHGEIPQMQYFFPFFWLKDTIKGHYGHGKQQKPADMKQPRSKK